MSIYVVVLDFGRILVPCVPDVPKDVSTAGSRTGSSLSLFGNADCARVVTPDLGTYCNFLFCRRRLRQLPDGE